MADKLLVRAYHVEVGDCIYIRIPDGNSGFHILVDCGSKVKKELLKRVLAHLEQELPSAGASGKKRLDLLVASHIHEDHIKGFDPDTFKNIQIGHIWLSAIFNPQHPQAGNTMRLHSLAEQQVRSLTQRGLALTPELQSLMGLYSIDNDGALDALRRILPDMNGIQPQYVHAGVNSTALGVNVPNAVIHVLAPEEDIDRFYLGVETVADLNSFVAASDFVAQRAPATKGQPLPKNITESDFRRLQSRMLSTTLAFADIDSSTQNNVSAVLLIEWRNRRLLFVGDAEWDGKFEEGRHNGSWNVMWHERKALLEGPLDFLKIGHHGSINATPWSESYDAQHEVNQILDAILPLPQSGNLSKAQAIVSTARTNVYVTIPAANLLAEIGKRVKNSKRYKRKLEEIGASPQELPHFANFEALMLDEPQPARTDFERILTGSDFVEVIIEAGDS
jgi:beta-lactamase superfamily II metal-dependent hydrolase